MRRLAISTSQAFLLVYSVDDSDSFKEISQLRQLILEERGEGVPIVVVGNKSDVPVEQRAVVKETAEAIACVDWNHGYVEATAKDNSQVVPVFKEILRQAKISYNLSPALRRKRQSLPNLKDMRDKQASADSSVSVTPGGARKSSLVKRLFLSQKSCPK